MIYLLKLQRSNDFSNAFNEVKSTNYVALMISLISIQ